MVYAMMSIGVLGFVVWSWILASPHSDMGIYNFAVSWNGLVLIGTLNGKNSISYTQSAGNLSLYSTESKIQSASETIRVTSFNFSAFRQYYNTLFGNDAQHLSNNWLTWFIGFVEGCHSKRPLFKQTHAFYVHIGCINCIMGLTFWIVLFTWFFNSTFNYAFYNL